MGQQREAATMAEFFKFKKIGQGVAGRIIEFKKSNNGDFIVLSPVLVKDNREGGWTRYYSLALGLTTDIKMKLIPEQDKGAMFAFYYVDNQPTTKGSPRKVFVVEKLEKQEIAELSAGCEKIDDVYRAPVATMAEMQHAENEDDLPF